MVQTRAPADGDRQGGDEPRRADRRGARRAHAADVAPRRIGARSGCARRSMPSASGPAPCSPTIPLLTVRDCYRAAAAGARGVRPPAAHAADGAALLDARRGAGHNSDDGGRCRRPSRTSARRSTAAGATLVEGAGDLRRRSARAGGVRHLDAAARRRRRRCSRGLAGGRRRSRAPDRGADGARRGAACKLFDGIDRAVVRVDPGAGRDARAGRVDGGGCSRASLKRSARWPR